VRELVTLEHPPIPPTFRRLPQNLKSRAPLSWPLCWAGATAVERTPISETQHSRWSRVVRDREKQLFGFPGLARQASDNDEVVPLAERISKDLFKSQTTSLMATLVTSDNTSSHTAEVQVKDTE